MKDWWHKIEILIDWKKCIQSFDEITHYLHLIDRCQSPIKGLKSIVCVFLWDFDAWDESNADAFYQTPEIIHHAQKSRLQSWNTFDFNQRVSPLKFGVNDSGKNPTDIGTAKILTKPMIISRWLLCMSVERARHILCVSISVSKYRWTSTIDKVKMCVEYVLISVSCLNIWVVECYKCNKVGIE